MTSTDRVHILMAAALACGLASCGPSTCPETASARPATMTTSPPPVLEPLAPALEKISARYNQKMDAAARAEYETGVAEIRATGVVQGARKVGEVAPEFELLTGAGQSVSLKGLTAKGPVVVIFFRGVWCPYCNSQLERMERDMGAFSAAGASIVAISPQRAEHTAQTVTKSGLTFSVLSDDGGAVARAFGVSYAVPERLGGGKPWLARYNGGDGRELPLAATFVVDRAGVVRGAFVAHDYRVRAEPQAVLETVRACR